jgi:hypothetical protein
VARPSSPKKAGSGRTSGEQSSGQWSRPRLATGTDQLSDISTSETADQTLHQERLTAKECSGTVPKALVKFVIGLFLLPLAWVLTITFFESFLGSLHHGMLASQSFGCIVAGMLLFGVLFFIIPRRVLMLPYVFGHEVTHALWVKLFGGNVADRFHVSLDGGHVLTDRVNTWIALAPYFFPLYSILLITLYGAASLAADLTSYRWILFLLLGFTLAFHLVFTCLLITKGQPDLHYGGTFFSLMVIYLINLLILIALLLVAGKGVTIQSFGADFSKNAGEFIDLCGSVAGWISGWIADFRVGLGK